MSFCKRSLTLLCAFVVMALEVFSFAPFSFASSSDFEFSVDYSTQFDNVLYLSNGSDCVCFAFNGSFSSFTFTNLRQGNSIRFKVYPSSGSASSPLDVYTFTPSGSSSVITVTGSSFYQFYSTPLDFPAFPCSAGYYSNINGVSTSNVSLYPISISFPSSNLNFSFFDYSPFYFPEMPHGYFDGNINVVDGSYSLDLSNVTGTTSNSGDTTTFEHYTFTVPQVVSDFDMVHQSQYTTYDGTITSPSYTVSGQTTNTVHYVETGTLDINGSAPVLYTPAYNENSRFRCWSCVMDSSFVWFVSDTRNKITGSIVSVTSDEVSWKYEFSDPNGGNTLYPVWGIVFSPMGEVIQVLSPQTVSNKNVFILTCSIGSLEQDSESGKWSVDPLYHGLWFSQDSPPVQNISYLNVGDNKKYLANPVFGDFAFQLNFLDSINDNLIGLRSDLASLQSAMTSSISNQTSTFQNMDAASGFDPTDVQNMLDYGSLESNYHAPSTDQLFSVSGGTYTDGMAFWRDRMNELLYYSGSPILGLTTFVMTLGLAALVIGRRISGGGTA